ncbi:Plant Tudor-like RNA-binding protein, partial [Prunus dulcis]
MRFKKGNKVEILSEKEVPSVAWRCAEIISGNGHTYSVKYDRSPGKDSQAVVERVPRKDIRPCPPPVQSAEIWQLVMLLRCSMLVSGKWLRLLGSSEEFRVHKHRIRVRQFWKDDKWVVIGKGSDNRISSQVPQLNARIKLPAVNDCVPPLDIISYQDSHNVSSRSLKRASPYCSFYIDGYSRKRRAIEKGCESQHIFSGSPSSFLKKVDAVAYPRENLGEKYVQASFINRTTGCFEKEREELNGAISLSVERSSELDDCDSDACSVGTSQDSDTLSSDADSFCGDAQEKFSVPLEEDVPAGIHRLELNAYHSTLVAMHASGSLTWEQEALLTNLRISLHISNDEHLIEVHHAAVFSSVLNNVSSPLSMCSDLRPRLEPCLPCLASKGLDDAEKAQKIEVSDYKVNSAPWQKSLSIDKH